MVTTFNDTFNNSISGFISILIVCRRRVEQKRNAEERSPNLAPERELHCTYLLLLILLLDIAILVTSFVNMLQLCLIAMALKHHLKSLSLLIKEETL